MEVNFILLWTWRTFKDKQGLSSRWVGQGDPVEILISVLPFAITAPSISTGGPWDDSPSSIWYSTIMCYSWNPYYHKWRCSVGESKFKQWSRVWALLLGKILRREGCILSRRRCGGVLSYAPSVRIVASACQTTARSDKKQVQASTPSELWIKSHW